MERYELGQLLINKGIITHQQLDKALLQQKQSNKFLGECLLENGFLTREQLLEALTEQKRADIIHLAKFRGIKPEVVKLIPESIARRYVLLGVTKSEDSLIVAMKDPTDIVAIDTVKRITGSKVKIVRAEERDILEKIEKYYSDGENITETLAALEEVTENREEEVDLNQLKVAAEDAPIVRFVNSIFLQAVEKRATDIHLEPQADAIQVRFRIDGVMQIIPPPPKSAFMGIVTRLKILSNLDIGERRLPQDGRVMIKVRLKEIDIRVSTLPTVYGEKIVMRLLDRESLVVDMEQLGFEKQDLDIFKSALQVPQGMILVTGPTGSGKTTTLYAGLSFINTPDKNIMTVEDPVEYELVGINQVHIKPKIGLTFPAVLRTMLRQDPDVIMVGEIRDLETAQIAIQSALTGHLVISTLHTNDTVATISRLGYMGVEPYLLAASFNLIMAQRLVRKICNSCKEEDKESRELLDRIDMGQYAGAIYAGKGCRDCEFTGYFGRVAIYELLPVTKELRKMIVDRASEDVIRDYARKNGMVSLRAAAMKKVALGITTVQEAMEVTLT